MEAILLALLASYGLPALAAGAFAFGVWTVHIKFFLPERAKRREKEEQREDTHIQIVAKNTDAFNELRSAVVSNTLAFGDLRMAVNGLGTQLHNLDNAVIELRRSISDLGHDFRNSRETQERLEGDVGAVKDDIKELKGYIVARRDSSR